MRVSVSLAAATAACLVLAGPQPAHAAVGTAARTAPSFNGSVYAIAQRGSTVYVGGSFTSMTIGGRSVSRERLAAFDARTGELLDWQPRADDTVRALAVSGPSVYAAGDFDEISGHPRDSLARIDAGSGEVGSFAHSVDGGTRALAVGRGRLYLAGSFVHVDGERRQRLAAFSLTTGELDDDWAPSADNTVYSLAYANSRVYAGGNFHGRLSALDPDTGDRDPDFRPPAPAVVYAIAADAGRVYAAMGGPGGSAAAYGTATGRTRWKRAFDGDAQAIAVLDGVAYVGGHFDEACGDGDTAGNGTCRDGSSRRVKLAAVDPDGSLSDWDPRANGVFGVRALTVDRANGTVAAGGDFTTIGGRAQRRYATFG